MLHLHLHRWLFLAALLCACVVAVDSSAQTPVVSGAVVPCPGSTSGCFKPPVAGIPLGYQQMTSLASATALPSIPTAAQEALIICTGQSVEWRDDGTAPTATIGMPLAVNTTLVYTGQLSAFQIIQTAATATCNVSYYR